MTLELNAEILEAVIAECPSLNYTAAAFAVMRGTMGLIPEFRVTINDRDHRCHLTPKSDTSMEPHGETHSDAWYECSICGAKYDESEALRLQEG